MKISKIELSELKNNEIFQHLKNIAMEISCKYSQNISDINVEKVIFESDTSINVDFIIRSNSSSLLAEMNYLLSRKLSEEKNLLRLGSEFIPSFISFESK